jgi:hypothetical protein
MEARDACHSGFLLPDQQAKTKLIERKSIMNEKANNPASDMLDQGLKNYEQALRTGLKFQEEAAKSWTKLFGHAATPQDIQKQITSLANEVIPATRKSMDDCLELLEQNSRTSVDLLKKSLEAAQASNYADTQSKVVDFCEASLKALRANAQAIVNINCKAVDSWFAYAKKAVAVAPEPKAQKG